MRGIQLRYPQVLLHAGLPDIGEIYQIYIPKCYPYLLKYAMYGRL
jgi:hypothetical protein